MAYPSNESCRGIVMYQVVLQEDLLGREGRVRFCKRGVGFWADNHQSLFKNERESTRRI